MHSAVPSSASAVPSSSSSAESVESPTPKPPPAVSAGMSTTSPSTVEAALAAVSIPATISTFSTSSSMSSPTRVVSTSSSTNASFAVPASTTTAVPAVVPPPEEVPEAAEAAPVVDEVCPDSEYRKDDPEELVIVLATAEFENSPLQNLVQEDLASLEKFICSEEHLQKNIARIEFEVVSEWKVDVKLHVIRKNLWEGPQKYVWKFLGSQNFWDRHNGTKIRLKRIHVK